MKKVWLNPVRGFLSDEFYSMRGLGAVYSRVSSYMFADWNKCGEVMGLAPYGTPNAFRPLIEIQQDGELKIPDWDVTFNKPWLVDREKKWDASPKMQHWKDLAWRVQDDTETVLLERARWLRETTGAKNLVLSGGVALNCVANGRIVREAGFEKVWIQPAAGDNGIAIGCALYGHLEVLKQPRKFVMRHAYLGRPYTDAEIKAPLEKRLTKMQTVVQALRRHLQGEREAARRGPRLRLVPGPLGVWTARARQPHRSSPIRASRRSRTSSTAR